MTDEPFDAERLQSAVATIYATPAGQLLADWLDQAFVRRRVQPSEGEAQLWHAEGQRALALKLKDMERAWQTKQRQA